MNWHLVLFLKFPALGFLWEEAEDEMICLFVNIVPSEADGVTQAKPAIPRDQDEAPPLIAAFIQNRLDLLGRENVSGLAPGRDHFDSLRRVHEDQSLLSSDAEWYAQGFYGHVRCGSGLPLLKLGIPESRNIVRENRTDASIRANSQMLQEFLNGVAVSFGRPFSFAQFLRLHPFGEEIPRGHEIQRFPSDALKDFRKDFSSLHFRQRSSLPLEGGSLPTATDFFGFCPTL